MNLKPFLIVITGEKNIGKTSFIEEFYKILSCERIPAAGICEIKSDDLNGYFIKNLFSGEKFRWADKVSCEPGKVPFRFYSENLEMIIESFAKSLKTVEGNNILFFDEYGKMEKAGKGLIEVFKRFMLSSKISIVVVQKAILEYFLSEYDSHFEKKIIINLAADDSGSSEKKIREIITYIRDAEHAGNFEGLLL